MNYVNDKVYSNSKYEFTTMMSAVPNLSYVVTHYASHHLRENVQLSVIETNMR